jgi:hypothetical protein
VFAATALLLVAGHHLYAPYRLRDTIAQAVQSGRPELLTTVVDFAAIRESARQQLERKLASDPPPRSVRPGRAALDALILRNLMQQYVDRVSTADGMVRMLQGREFMQVGSVLPLPSDAPSPFESASVRWESVTRVQIPNVGSRDGKGGVTLVLTRTLTGWQVSDLDLERAL